MNEDVQKNKLSDEDKRFGVSAKSGKDLIRNKHYSRPKNINTPLWLT